MHSSHVVKRSFFFLLQSKGWEERWSQQSELSQIPLNQPFLQTTSSVFFILPFPTDPISIMISSYLTPEQRSILQHILHTHSVQLFSSYWLYSCIDRGCYLQVDKADSFDSLLYRPPPGYWLVSFFNIGRILTLSASV